MNDVVQVDWEPQERQLAALKACGLSEPFGVNLKLRPSGSKGEPLHKAVASHIGYGGAAGGGKTDLKVVAALVASIAYPGINVGYFRRKFPQLQGLGGAIDRSKIIYPKQICFYHKTEHKWIFDNGSQVAFCHCQNPDDVENYHSQQFDILMIDEVTQFLEEMVKYLLTRNRGTVSYPTFRPFALFGTNPGNVGHSFFKREFVDTGPPEKLHTYVNETGEKETHYFIPAKVDDNQILLERDPEYPIRLSPNPHIRKRLLDGDWEQVEGSEFDEMRRSKHVIQAIIPKKKFKRYLGTDWGYTGKKSHQGAFGTLVLAVIKAFYLDEHQEKSYFHRAVVYSEWYGKKKSPESWAEEIYDSIDTRDIQEGRADSSMFDPAKDGTASIVDKMEAKWEELHGKWWIRYKRGTRNRINRVATLHDWLKDAPDGLPYLVFTENCKHTIRTIPLLMTDPNDDRDVDTEMEDHLYDALTYILTAIKFIDVKAGKWQRQKPLPAVPIAYEIDEKGEKGMDLAAFENVKPTKPWTAI